MLGGALGTASVPILIDEPALTRLAAAGYRFSEGQTGLVRYRWLLPPAWVAAATVPARGRNGIEPLCGVGDPTRRFTAVLGVLRGCAEPPHLLVERGAPPSAQISVFSSRVGAVAERVDRRDGRITVTTVHAVVAGGEPYRFLVAALGPGDERDALTTLRTLGAALSLADDLDRSRPLRLGG